MPRSSSSQPKRKHLTLQQKVLIIEKREREGLKQDELSRWAAAEFRLPKVPTQPTISNILKNKDKLLEALRRNPRSRVKSVRDVKCPAFVEALVAWIHAQECQVTRRSILEYALEKRSEFPGTDELLLSEGWLTRILARYGIRLNGAEGSVYSEEEEEEEEEEGGEEGDAEEEEEEEQGEEDQEMEEDEGAGREEGGGQQEKEPASRREGVTPTKTKGTAQKTKSLRSQLKATQGRTRVEPDNDAEEVYGHVREYYSHVLTKSSDLKTDANDVSREKPHALIRELMALLPDQAQAKYFGCGVPIPLGIHGLNVLDLGCGTGRDACVLSALVGLRGKVTAVDMRPEIVDDARYYARLFTERLSEERGLLTFVEGYIEQLDQINGINAGSFDLATANFAISLSPDKERALRQVYRALRVGGEFHFCDIYATRRLPDSVRIDEMLHNEGLGGAFYIDDFTALSREIGFGQPRQVCVAPITIRNEQLAAQVGSTQFFSITFRCFKVPNMEMREQEEDYGHVAKYLGTIQGYPLAYELDASHRFETRRPVRVGGNTAAILTHSWLAKYFHVDGDWSEHFGRFSSSEKDSTVTRTASLV